MSTRCQVQIINDAGEPQQSLYRHCDGYPSNMVPLLQIAAARASESGTGNYNAKHEVIATDPQGFEDLAYHELHGDLEYLYHINPSPEGWHLTIHHGFGCGANSPIYFNGPIVDAPVINPAHVLDYEGD